MSEPIQDDLTESRSHRSSRRRKRRRAETNWNVIIAIAAVAAVAAAFAPGKPTGIAFFDVIERAAFAFAVTLFGAAARRWSPSRPSAAGRPASMPCCGTVV